MEIRLENVTKYYQDGEKSTKGIEGVNLTLNTDGSFVVITGESGAGKSTLIKILTGLEDFDEGEISFDGVPLSGMSEKERQTIYANNISFVFQDYNLVESFSALENVTIALLKQGKGIKEAKKKALEVLKEVGLEKQARMSASKLSGGERQRVAIARSLALDTKVIIFDEPTGNLDQDTSKAIIELINRVKGNRLVVYVTHEFYQVEQYVTRHIVLSDGHVIKDDDIKPAEGNGAELKADLTAKKFPVKSYLYSASLFSFRRPGRFILTFIAMAVAVLVMFAGAFGTGEMLAMEGSLTSSSDHTDEKMFGNVISARKDAYDEADLSYDDAYNDKEGLMSSHAFSFMEAEAYQAAYDNNEAAAIADSSSLTIQEIAAVGLQQAFITPYFLDSYKVAEEYTGEASYPKVYYILQNASNVAKSEAYKDIKENLGKTAYLYNSTVMEPKSSYKAYFDIAPKVTIGGIYLSDSDVLSSGSYSYSSTPYIYTDLACYKTLASFIGSYYGKTIPGLGTSIYTSKTYEAVLKDADGKRLDYYDFTYSYNDYNGYNASCCLVVDSSYKNTDISLDIDGISVPLSKLDNVIYEDSLITSGGTNAFITSRAVNTVVYNLGLYQEVVFSSKAKANEAYNELKAKNKDVFLYDAYVASPTVLPDFDTLDVSYRMLSLIVFGYILGGVFLLMLLMKSILGRFYYRQSDDQKVLSFIGYSFKDMVVINLIEFVGLAGIITAVSYPLLILLIPTVKTIFSLIPSLFIVSLVIGLLFAAYTALPRRKRVK